LDIPIPRGELSHAAAHIVFSINFDSGYVLVAYLDGELVRGLGWLTRAQLLDAIASGQFTPDPVLSTATFVGYQIQGSWGGSGNTGHFITIFCFCRPA